MVSATADFHPPFPFCQNTFICAPAHLSTPPALAKIITPLDGCLSCTFAPYCVLEKHRTNKDCMFLNAVKSALVSST